MRADTTSLVVPHRRFAVLPSRLPTLRPANKKVPVSPIRFGPEQRVGVEFMSKGEGVVVEIERRGLGA